MQITRETIVHATEADWLAARTLDITSTECAGLFDVGVYDNARTFYELYQIKSGALPPAPFQANDRTVWGNRLESAIAHGVAEDCGLIVEPFKVYMRIPELRMGSSFDFKIVGLANGYSGDQTARDLFRKHGEGILEIKNVDGLQFRRNWTSDGETIEAPAHIEMQVAHQQEVAGLDWTIIAPLVGGNTPKTIFRERDEATGTAIRLKVAEFWTFVDAGIPPAPNFACDKDTIARLLMQNDGREIDLSDNPRLMELCMTSKAASDQIKVAEKSKETAIAEILTIIGTAKKANAAGGFSISAATIEPTWIEAYERKGYRRVVVNQKKV